MLVTAAAQSWSVAPDSCKTEAGKVIHSASGRSVAYGDLLEAASKITPPEKPRFKDPKDYKYIGKSVKRLDAPEKVNGKAVFGIDVKLPGLLTATLLRCPVIDGKVKSIDDAAAKAIPGVVAVVSLGYGVGVVAKDYWTARRGQNALKVVWDEGKMATVSSETIYNSICGRRQGKRSCRKEERRC